MDDFTGADISAAMTSASSDAPPAASSSASTPPEQTASTGTATTPPAAPTPPAKPQGPIPFDVHTRSMDNARAKAVEEYKAKYGWAETADQGSYNEAVALARRYQTDKIGYVRDLIAEMQADPILGPQLRSEAARALAAGRGQAAPTMPDPDVAITDANGNVVGQTYSAQQLAKRDAWLKDQFLTEIRQEIAPLVQTHKTFEEQQQDARDKVAGDTFAKGLMAEGKDLPHFDAHKKEIGADIVRQIQVYDQQHPDQLALPEGKRRSSQPEFLEAAFHRAYNRIVLPKIDSVSRQAVVGDLQTKATGSGVVPGRPPVGAAKSSADGKFSGADLAAEFARRRIG